VNGIFEISSHRHSIEMVGGVFEAFACSHMGYLFMGDFNDFPSDVSFFIGRFIGSICTVSKVIHRSFIKRSGNKDRTGMLGVLADHVIEPISGSGLSKGVIPLAFEVLGEREGGNTKCSGGLVVEGIIGIDMGISEQ